MEILDGRTISWYLDNTNRNVLHSQQLHVYADLVADVVNVAVGHFASLLAVDNNARSIEALFGSLTLYWLSGLLSGWTLLTTSKLLLRHTHKAISWFENSQT